MDTRSELTVDVEASISKAYDVSLPTKEQELVRSHLAYMLPKLREPNSLIVPVQNALVAMQGRGSGKKIHEHLVVRIIGSLVFALVVAGIVKLLGWN